VTTHQRPPGCQSIHSATSTAQRPCPINRIQRRIDILFQVAGPRMHSPQILVIVNSSRVEINSGRIIGTHEAARGSLKARRSTQTGMTRCLTDLQPRRQTYTSKSRSLVPKGRRVHHSCPTTLEEGWSRRSGCKARCHPLPKIR